MAADTMMRTAESRPDLLKPGNSQPSPQDRGLLALAPQRGNSRYELLNSGGLSHRIRPAKNDFPGIRFSFGLERVTTWSCKMRVVKVATATAAADSLFNQVSFAIFYFFDVG